MKKKMIYSLICLFFGLQTYVSAHSGRTDANGCHNDNMHGGYHCHNGGSEEIIEDNEQNEYQSGVEDGYYEGTADADEGINEWNVTGSQAYIDGFREGYDQGQRDVSEYKEMEEQEATEQVPYEDEIPDYVPEYTPEDEVDPGEDKVIDVVNKKTHVEQPSFFEKHSKGIIITVVCIIIIAIYIKRKR